MNILMVNKFFYVKGGSETYYFALKRLLESKGHKVIDFSMKNSKNLNSKYDKYFIEAVDYNGKNNIFKQIQIMARIIYSLEAKNKLEKLIKETKPDIAHLHLFQHQLSPSILDVLKQYNIPIVYTAHDLKMLCPNYQMMVNGNICEKCKDGKYFNCTIRKCIKNSVVKSLICTIEGYLHKHKKSYELIDIIITPSKFYRKKFIEFGVNQEKVFYISNFLGEKEPRVEQLEKNYYLYLGRLSAEKGIFTLMKAVKNKNIKLKIVGTGPLKEKILNRIINNEILNIEILGFKSGQDLINLIGNAKAVILPSEWYENGPYSAIEALQMGRPLIGADIGGIPELIRNNGFIFKPRDAYDLWKKIEEIEYLSTEEYKNMEKMSREIFNKNYSESIHFTKLFEVYKRISKNI